MDLIDRDALLKKLQFQQRYGSVQDSKGRAKAIIEVIHAPVVNRWIPCSERLPEDQTRVIIKTIYGSMCIAKRCGNGDWYTDGSGTYHAHEVASWMPLPEEGGEQ